MIHACYGMNCPYESWNGECGLKSTRWGYPEDAACEIHDREAYGEDADEDWEDEE